MNELAILTEVGKQLATIKTVGEAKDLRDKAEALRAYAKSARLGLAAQNQASYIKLLCERRGGEILIESGVKRGGSKSREGTLKNAGITQNQSSRWQALAQWPERELVKLRALCDDDEEELTLTLVVDRLREFLDAHDNSNGRRQRKQKKQRAERGTTEEATEQAETDPDDTEPQDSEAATDYPRLRLIELYTEAETLCGTVPAWGRMGTTLRRWIDQLQEEAL